MRPVNEYRIHQIEQSEYFLVILVDARHLDYSNTLSLLQTIAKHPSDGSKNGDVGHAWIYLQGIQNGERVFLEGGHSGERGIIQPKYFDGVMNYAEAGDPNPIRYLWECQHDGFFQWGNGGHYPTYAAKIDLTPEQFHCILNFIENYPFSHYFLTENQCSSFVTQVAARANFFLEDKIVIEMAQALNFGDGSIRLWTSPRYANLILSSPDILEHSLIQAVEEGQATDALEWYLHTHPVSLKNQLTSAFEIIHRFPQRLYRYKRVCEFRSTKSK